MHYWYNIIFLQHLFWMPFIWQTTSHAIQVDLHTPLNATAMDNNKSIATGIMFIPPFILANFSCSSHLETEHLCFTAIASISTAGSHNSMTTQIMKFVITKNRENIFYKGFRQQPKPTYFHSHLSSHPLEQWKIHGNKIYIRFNFTCLSPL